VNTDSVNVGPPALTIEGARATVRLCRPDRHNAMGPDDIATFVDLLARVEHERAARVLVLTATGPSFCSGYDLSALGAAPPERRAEASGGFGRMVDRLEALRVPTIAAMSGSVYGGGTDLALACDFRIGTPGIELRMSAARIGVQYYASGMRRFVSRLGVGAAKRLFLTAGAVPAEELARLGYLDAVVPDAALAGHVDALVEQLLANGPAAVQGMKAALNALAAGTADPGAIDDAARASMGSAEVVEGLAAYRERRSPRFPDP
jgi:enoyl-CoA hydratase/carnithine racemase